MQNTRSTLRRLWYAALFSAVRSFAAAAGAGVVTLVIWWLQGR